jgi:hypothetical protein
MWPPSGLTLFHIDDMFAITSPSPPLFCHPRMLTDDISTRIRALAPDLDSRPRLIQKYRPLANYRAGMDVRCLNDPPIPQLS